MSTRKYDVDTDVNNDVGTYVNKWWCRYVFKDIHAHGYVFTGIQQRSPSTHIYIYICICIHSHECTVTIFHYILNAHLPPYGPCSTAQPQKIGIFGAQQWQKILRSVIGVPCGHKNIFKSACLVLCVCVFAPVCVRVCVCVWISRSVEGAHFGCKTIF